MISFNGYKMKIKQNIIREWPYIPDNPYRIILIIRGSGSGKTNAL